MAKPSTFLHKMADFTGRAVGYGLIYSPLWMAGLGVAAGLLAAPLVGAGAVAAALIGGVAGLIGGAATFIGAGTKSSPRYLPAKIMLMPVAALELKLRVMALAGDVSPADKVRLKDAFTKAVPPTRDSRRILKSGALYANAALAVQQGRTMDSVVTAIENKTYPAYKYTP